MTDQFAVVDFTTPTGAGTFDITSPLITETCKGAVVIFSSITTDDSASTHAVAGIGFVADDGHTDEITAVMSVRSTDALTTTQTTRTAKFTTAAHAVVGALQRSAAGTDSTVDVRCEYSSFIAGGLRLDPVTRTAQTKGGALLIAGVARCYVGTFSAGAASAHEDVGSAANLFQPDLIIVSMTDAAFSDPSVLAPGTTAIGFVSRSPAQQLGAGVTWNNNADPSDGDGRVTTATLPSFDSARAFQAVTITIDSTGFNHQRTVGAGSPDGCYIAIKFTDAHRVALQNFVAPSGTGQTTFTPGFAPSLCFGISTLMTSTDADIDGPTASSFGYFMFTPTAARAVSVSSKEGITVAIGTPSVTRTIQGDHAILTLADTGSVAQQADWVSKQDNGFTLNFTTATAGLLSTLMIGPFESDETVTITESSSLVTSAFQANETVAISEGIVYASTTIFGEVVNISDGFLLLPTNLVQVMADRRGGTAQAGAVKGETVEASVDAGMTAG